MALPFTILAFVAATVYALWAAPDRAGILRRTFHLPDLPTELNLHVTNGYNFGSPVPPDLFGADGQVVFMKAAEFEAYAAALDDPVWRVAYWPPTSEQHPLPLRDDVGWRPLTPADQLRWRDLRSLGRPAGEDGRILCYYVVSSEAGTQGVPCDVVPPDPEGRVWAALDPANRTVYMEVESKTALGGTGIPLLDRLSY